MVMVDPAEQKKGHLSRIWKEALERYPDATFTLDATTPKSKAQYAHLGFEVNNHCVLWLASLTMDRFWLHSNWVLGRSQHKGYQQTGMLQQGLKYTQWPRWVLAFVDHLARMLKGRSSPRDWYPPRVVQD